MPALEGVGNERTQLVEQIKVFLDSPLGSAVAGIGGLVVAVCAVIALVTGLLQ
ncbi:MAG: hypothetical protein E6640_01835 [Actinomyces urogenitalis]|uniref:hypothetical protein n=1 Tax=Actinomyces urogenitalis TaxID=103621 RepID=UPI00290613D3|nr:hypothetical protein [Actinomyces urogenitalis]MDU6150952.1 hypothetical protein [Actinomyces urogenitalis]